MGHLFMFESIVVYAFVCLVNNCFLSIYEMRTFSDQLALGLFYN